MTTKNIVLERVRDNFPLQINIINELFEESESFRTLCEDYVDCQTVIEQHECNMKIIDREMINDYKQLFKELEEEIRIHLQI